MPRKRTDLLQGTLDMLILKVLTMGPMHGYAIARRIQQTTDDVLKVEEGSLYPALYRMAARGLIESDWGTSDNNRRAKFYSLTPQGKKRLAEDVALWERFSRAAGQVLALQPERS
ncbi:MAG: PadR family transcriptional regulator [Rubricoccaceae bacterium]